MKILDDTIRWAQRLLDAPGRNQVIYGYGPDLWPNNDTEGHVWYCGRCRTSGIGLATLFDAFDAAEAHAGTHDGMATYRGNAA